MYIDLGASDTVYYLRLTGRDDLAGTGGEALPGRGAAASFTA